MVNVIPMLLAIGGKAISKTFQILLATFLTKKVLLRIAMGLLEKLFKSTKTTLDDSLWFKTWKPLLEAEIERKD